MQLAKVRTADGIIRFGAVAHGKFHAFSWPGTLGDLLAAPNPETLTAEQLAANPNGVPFTDVTILPPVDKQEIWAAGVTYKRSKLAREEESAGAASFYDKVYSADRPELFMKASSWRAVPTGGKVRIRADGKWNVPEPELTLVISPALKIVGYTIGNDMSSRDIEGENPLYLPQAKIYDGSCAIGPVITLVSGMPPLPEVSIKLTIERDGKPAFEGTTNLGMMARTPEALVEWLGKEMSFPDGVLLMTGTGIVPPDAFTLASSDVIHITIDGIGTLTNTVA
ncbi:fumarylacetoacetate hydrolase family protein [Zavarzinella formosa]|uniref:fumarylacetoacetate hydrolase family protein n=1 Tax=Zavarzinella formosa TaxID=360055 RepID=UPI0002E4F38B|nr:fumarylacetoacetate hydrolase family protein [Zavarzinella formosa]